MFLYNTLGRRKEAFTPLRPGKATIYVCGITAYDLCHIGHARSALVFDVLVRRLRRLGLEVLFVRNFTDVDDKIINRAKQEGRDWREVAETYMAAFHEDMDRLGILRADLEPRATQHMDGILRLCGALVDAGKAYPTPGGDVYFRVRDFPGYGGLSGRSLDDLLAGARVEPGEEKEDPLDFALWKASKPGEPAWESPWGPGRPGWHIECSAMSSPYIPLDIHGGGQDLIFPHHENEIAQTEAACGCTLARHWMHNGFVRIDHEKMSKSLGNFQTIREVLDHYLPETLRYFLLSKHYRSPVDFSSAGMDDAERALHRVYSCLSDVRETLAGKASGKSVPLPKDVAEEAERIPRAFEEAMDDDLNTAMAMGHIFSMVRLANRVLETKGLRQGLQGHALLESFLGLMEDWGGQLGLFAEPPQAFLDGLRAIQARRAGIDMTRVEGLLAERLEARQRKDFSASDALREELQTLGVIVRDTPRGQTWDIA
ncbi:MAG: cysteine--tRNA ligase [Desulfovibrio sp.]|jgi:cysteinyl-tRNA synthetase|nr:cysteine--tRNA ligase [Desulfovibrio sp.]